MKRWELSKDERITIAARLYDERTGMADGDGANAFLDGIFLMLRKVGADEDYLEKLEADVWDYMDKISRGLIEDGVELAPCPHCGKYNIVFSMDEGCDYWTLVCDAQNGGCGANCGYAPTKREAVEKWNRRA